MPELKNHYQILQVDPGAEPEIIAAAYKRLAQKYHPDANKSPDATRRMQVINAAYRVLSDPGERRRYDLALRQPRPAEEARRSPATASAPPPRSTPTPASARAMRKPVRRPRPFGATDSVLGCGSVLIYISAAVVLFLVFETRLTSIVTVAALLIGAGVLTIPAVYFFDDYLRKM